MFSIKPGRGPSGMSAFSAVIAVVFGIFWTFLAFYITAGTPGPFHIFFPLFGILFIMMALGKFLYSLSNATREKRFSDLDITTDREEPDPLNTAFGAKGESFSASVEARLKEVDALRARGVISVAEAEAQRERILREI